LKEARWRDRKGAKFIHILPIMNHAAAVRFRRKVQQILAASVLIAVLPVTAEVRLPRIFGDGMMLQRDLPVRVWGWADAGESVCVTLAGKSATAKTDAKGEWSIELPALKTGENLELNVKGKNSRTLKNILIGDIWICSGQSNMEMALGGCLGAPEDIKAANHPKIRRIKIGRLKTGVTEADAPIASSWQSCSPATAAQFTAVGFYFSREIQQKTGVPIGIVDVNWGGTLIEPWVAAEGLEMVAELKPQLVAKQEALKAYQAQLSSALGTMETWAARSRKELAMGVLPGSVPGLPTAPGDAWSGLYNGMIHPLLRFPIKGALWYQGESNGKEGKTYYDKMRALIGGWRKNWGQGDFPFYYVQLACYQNVTEDPAGGDGWAGLREAQVQALALPNTGMAVVIDTVPLAERTNIHPKNKYDAGLRLARWALARDYGQKQLVVSGPMFKALKIEGGRARLAFDHPGTGLMVGSKEGRSPAVENKEGKLKRFSIAGVDKKWFWAEAVIEGDTVSVSSPEVKEPVAVRYAYQMNPDGANLYNRDGLPASPFRTDAFPTKP
jgi:sialate O-acetylesterase